MTSTTKTGNPRLCNFGYLSNRQSKKLSEMRVAVAGTGGVGGELAFQLACLGVGSLFLADPDTFDVSNLNRQRGAQRSTLGHLKVDVIARLIAEHDPTIKVHCFSEGVTPENLDDFLLNVDLVVEATDYTQAGIGLMIAREAAKRGIPVLLGAEIGWGVTATMFEPGGYSYEKFLGLTGGNTELKLSSLIGHIPSYADINVLAAVQSGAMKAPALITAVTTSGATLASQAVKRLTGGRPTTAPRLLHIDPHGPTKKVIRWRTLHYWMSLIHCVVRCKLGLNEKMEL